MSGEVLYVDRVNGRFFTVIGFYRLLFTEELSAFYFFRIMRGYEVDICFACAGFFRKILICKCYFSKIRNEME